MYSVYRHKSPSGKVYVGISCRKNVAWRWNHGRGYREKDQPYFARAIKKYGWENMSHEILFDNLCEERAKLFEIELIRFYKMLGISYNMTDGGDGHKGTYNRSHIVVSEETRRRMSKAHKGLLAGPLNPMYGKHETAPAYNKFSKRHPASKVVYQYDKNGQFIKKWDCLSDVQRELGLIVTNITAVCRGRRFTLGGFRWSYSYPYVFSSDEFRRREEKKRKQSLIAKEGYKTGRRKRMSGKDNPMSKENKSIRQFDAELRSKDDERKDRKEIEMKRIEAQKQIAKSKNTSSGAKK